MPKLLSINNYHYPRGGAEVVFLEQNRLFAQTDWEVVTFCMQHSKNLSSDWEEYFVDEIEFGEDYSLWEKIQLAPKTLYSFEAKKKVSELVAATKPDIAHCHNIYHHISPSILTTLKQHNVPIFLTLHDLKIACPAYKMLNSKGVCERCKGGRLSEVIRNRCLKGSLLVSGLAYLEARLHKLLSSYEKHVTKFVVPSKFYKDKLIEWGWPAERFVYVPNFVDSSSFRPNFEPGDYFLYFGRLAEEKGVDTLIRSAAKAGVKLHIAGAGPELNRMQQLASSSGADITFLGYQTGDELHRVIAGSKCVVLPSEWYENAPISIMEAYALGKPVIGANIGGIPELIDSNHSGLLFRAGDEEDLANALVRIEEMPTEDIAELGRFGCSWVENEFTSEKYVDRLIKIYKEFGDIDN